MSHLFLGLKTKDADPLGNDSDHGYNPDHVYNYDPDYGYGVGHGHDIDHGRRSHEQSKTRLWGKWDKCIYINDTYIGLVRISPYPPAIWFQTNAYFYK